MLIVDSEHCGNVTESFTRTMDTSVLMLAVEVTHIPCVGAAFVFLQQQTTKCMRFLSFPIIFLVKLCCVTKSNFTKPVIVARTPAATMLEVGFHVLDPAISRRDFWVGVESARLKVFLCVLNGLIGQIRAGIKDCHCQDSFGIGHMSVRIC